MNKLINTSKKLLIALNGLFLLWIIISWFDVCMHNGINDGDVHVWNALRLLVLACM